MRKLNVSRSRTGVFVPIVGLGIYSWYDAWQTAMCIRITIAIFASNPTTIWWNNNGRAYIYIYMFLELTQHMSGKWNGWWSIENYANTMVLTQCVCSMNEWIFNGIECAYMFQVEINAKKKCSKILTLTRLTPKHAAHPHPPSGATFFVGFCMSSSVVVRFRRRNQLS